MGGVQVLSFPQQRESSHHKVKNGCGARTLAKWFLDPCLRRDDNTNMRFFKRHASKLLFVTLNAIAVFFIASLVQSPVFKQVQTNSNKVGHVWTISDKWKHVLASLDK